MMFRFQDANLTEIHAGVSASTVEVAPAHSFTDVDAPARDDDMVCLCLRRDEDADMCATVGLTPAAAVEVAKALLDAAFKVATPPKP